MINGEVSSLERRGAFASNWKVLWISQPHYLTNTLSMLRHQFQAMNFWLHECVFVCVVGILSL